MKKLQIQSYGGNISFENIFKETDLKKQTWLKKTDFLFTGLHT
jgi:hypothetical protein